MSAQYTNVELFDWGHCSSISSCWGFHHLRWRPLQDGSAPSTSASETNNRPRLFDIAYKFSPTPPSPQMSAISKARIQSVGRRQHTGVWFSSFQDPQSVEKWDSTAGWPGAPRAHHAPLGEGLVSPKPCLTQYTTNQLVHSSFITCGNICEAHQAEEKRKLKAISSQRPEFPCPLCSTTTWLWTPAVSLPQENPTPWETAALTKLENEQQQWARRQYIPQGGSNLSQQPPVSPGSYPPSASIFNPECSRFPNKSSNAMTPTTKVSVRYMCIYSREYLTQKNKDPYNPQRGRKKTYALIMSVSSAAP